MIFFIVYAALKKPQQCEAFRMIKESLADGRC